VEIFLELLRQGQSYWLDSLGREMVRGGELELRVQEQGLRGVTSNPAIFHKAISSGSSYDEQIAELAHAGASVEEIYEALVVTDIREACDVLEPVYGESAGVDGYVSLEVSPHLVHDTRGSLDEARRLWAAVDRPNLMIKIPGTAAGVPAIEELLYEGVNVNVTLLFAVEAYEAVARAYVRALERRASEGKPLDTVASVASFFLSRIDVLVDQFLSHRVPSPEGEPAAQALYGRAAVASAKLAYRSYQDISSTPEWQTLAAAGARPQRLLWASTSTKNPLYDPVRYVEPLVGRDTVNTMPEVTIEAFADAGRVIPDAVEQDVVAAESVFTDLAAVGIDMAAVDEQLLAEGAQKFIGPFDALMAGLAEKRAAMLAERAPRVTEPEEAPGLGPALSALGEQRFSARLVARDPRLWPANEEARGAIANRLGWARGSAEIDRVREELEAFAEEVRAEGITDVVLLGMGGSSLCPLVAAASFPGAEGSPLLTVLDSVDPAAVSAVDGRIDPMRTLFLVASKSGGTIETLTLYRYFRGMLEAEDVPAPGRHFVAITDPGSPLVERAENEGFRRAFEAPADVGGRYSALTAFGLLPMALMGADLDSISSSVRQMEHACSPGLPESANPAVRLGTALALYAKAGRDKLTLSATPSLDRFPLWIEQLVAESTGKDGRGIVPVTHEGVPSVAECSPDRVFVHYALAGDPDPSVAALDALAAAGHPVFRIDLPRPEDLGGEFLRWEIATAAAGVLLGVNPFDEPDVSAAKQATAELLEERSVGGGFPRSEVQAVEESVEILAPDAQASAPDTTASDALVSWLEAGAEDGYVAVLGYFEATPARDDLLVRLRNALRSRTGRATTFGVGPRYLHSTGQLHKGGPDKGLFLVLTTDAAEDRDVPDSEFSLGTLLRAQALGDVRTLRERGRPVVHAHLGWRVEDGLETLAKVVEEGA
jgi:transaldolase/glucose-6-phosphate isomerase